MSDNKFKQHPNSLKNLTHAWNSETAKEASKLAVAKKKANAEARKALKMSMADWSAYKRDVLETVDVTAMDTLKILMMKALDANDFDTAADLAKTLAEFEMPKLARVEQKVEEVNANDLTDEELEAKLQELAKK